MKEDILPTTRDAARAVGSARYNDGRPCKHGHTSGRYTSNGQCIDCVKGHSKKHREKRMGDDPDAYRALMAKRRRVYYEKHADRLREYNREYMREYRETEEGQQKIDEAQQRWIEANVEEKREYMRAYGKSERGKETHKAAHKRWYDKKKQQQIESKQEDTI